MSPGRLHRRSAADGASGTSSRTGSLCPMPIEPTSEELAVNATKHRADYVAQADALDARYEHEDHPRPSVDELMMLDYVRWLAAAVEHLKAQRDQARSWAWSYAHR